MSKKENLKNYVESKIDFTGYNKDGAILLDTFNNVYITFFDEYGNWNGESVNSIKERLLGLPSCLNIEFTYYDIGNVLKNCGYKHSVDQAYQDKYYWGNIAKIIYSYK